MGRQVLRCDPCARVFGSHLGLGSWRWGRWIAVRRARYVVIVTLTLVLGSGPCWTTRVLIRPLGNLVGLRYGCGRLWLCIISVLGVANTNTIQLELI